MTAQRLILLMGILCVMAAMGADVWVTNQEALVHTTLQWSPASREPAPTHLDEAHAVVMQANLPLYRTTVTTMGVVGWGLIAESLIAIIVAAVQPRRRR